MTNGWHLVREERTGWRDERLSARHRRWGWDCPMLDIDFIGLEYDTGEPCVVVEYKHENAQLASPNHPSYRALRSLGTRAGVPVLGVRYADDFSWYRVTPLNAEAREYVTSQEQMAEPDYVALLYRIRGRDMPSDLFDLAPIDL